MDTAKTHIGKMEAQLKHWGSRLDGLVLQSQKAGTEAKDDYRKAVAELKTKHQAAQARLDELRTVGSDKWDAFKANMDRTWTEFEAAFTKLKH
ncbi:MAG: hypothetical protein IPL40_13655 [Proteobacteria bacterium]|nr:hypothetical protein [Pseudomonadota bacterium]